MIVQKYKNKKNMAKMAMILLILCFLFQNNFLIILVAPFMSKGEYILRRCDKSVFWWGVNYLY